MILNNKKKIILGIALTTALNTSMVFAADNNSKDITTKNTKNIVVENKENTNKNTNKNTDLNLTASLYSSSYYAESASLSGPTLILKTSYKTFFTDISTSANNVGRNSRNSSNEVKMVQILLNHYGYDIDVDGRCGSATIRAIRGFQSDYSLSSDGICGHDTWVAFCDNF